MSLGSFAQALKEGMGEAGKRVSTRLVPDWFIRLFARFERDAALVLPELGRSLNATSAKATRVLGWVPRPREEAVVASGKSLQQLGLLKARS